MIFLESGRDLALLRASVIGMEPSIGNAPILRISGSDCVTGLL
jgi:hypothetical protein